MKRPLWDDDRYLNILYFSNKISSRDKQQIPSGNARLLHGSFQ